MHSKFCPIHVAPNGLVRWRIPVGHHYASICMFIFALLPYVPFAFCIVLFVCLLPSACCQIFRASPQEHFGRYGKFGTTFTCTVQHLRVQLFISLRRIAWCIFLSSVSCFGFRPFHYCCDHGWLGVALIQFWACGRQSKHNRRRPKKKKRRKRSSVEYSSRLV